MNLFRSEEHIARWLGDRQPGATISVGMLCDLSHVWWGDRLSPEWLPRPRDRSQALLEQLGLTGAFWALA